MPDRAASQLTAESYSDRQYTCILQERAELAYENISKAGPDLEGTSGVMDIVQKRVADGAQVFISPSTCTMLA